MAEPSLKTTAVGGAAQDTNRLTEPMLRPGAMDQFHDWYYEEDKVLEYHHPPMNGKIFKGLIGAQTALSGGTGSVADFAAAATAAGLDFVIFLEDITQMTKEKLETLKADVAKSSTPTLKLFAGVPDEGPTRATTCSRAGPSPNWPDERLLVGPDKRTFNLQYQDENGKFAFGNPALDWCINAGGSLHRQQHRLLQFYQVRGRAEDVRPAGVQHGGDPDV